MLLKASLSQKWGRGGDGLSLVVFSLAVSPRKGDAIHWKGQDYIVTRKQLFNGKPQIWIE
jgi:hypothetical protein